MAIAFDIASSGVDGAQAASITWSHTCTGTNLALIVGCGNSGTATTSVITSATYNAVDMGAAKKTQLAASNDVRSTIFGMIAPATGAHNVVVTYTTASKADEQTVSAVSYTGVDQSTPFGTAVGAAAITVNASSAAGELVVDAIYILDAAIVVGAGQTERVNNVWTGVSTLGMSEEAGAGTVTMSWTSATGTSAICAIPVKPVAAGGGVQVPYQPQYLAAPVMAQ